MRTGAVTAHRRQYLARKRRRVLGHIGARGTAYWNVRLLDHLFDFDEIRVHSRRPESRDAFAARLRRPRQAGHGDDGLGGLRARRRHRRRGIAARPQPEPLLKTEWIKTGALVVPYGTMSAVELSLTDIMDKIVVDDWGQCRKGRPVRRAARARRHRPADGGRRSTRSSARSSRAARPGREQRRRDDPALAPRPEHLRHRARPRHAREGEARLGIGQSLRFA